MMFGSWRLGLRVVGAGVCAMANAGLLGEFGLFWDRDADRGFGFTAR